jgi:SAM-dependent methyltransferase
MLDVARNRAAQADVHNVLFERGDAQVHDLGHDAFDVAISRFGTMFFNDPVAAFANIASSMSANGRLVFATWQPLETNEWLTIPCAALLRYGSTPKLGDGPGMFSQSDPQAIAATLEQAGLDEIEPVAARLRLTLGTTIDDATEYLTETAVGRTVLATIPTEQKPAAVDALASALSRHTDATGVHLEAAVWITTATNPGTAPA